MNSAAIVPKSLLSSPTSSTLLSNGSSNASNQNAPSSTITSGSSPKIGFSGSPTSPSSSGFTYEGRVRVFGLDNNHPSNVRSLTKPDDTNGFGSSSRSLFSPARNLSLSVAVASLDNRSPDKQLLGHPIFGSSTTNGNGVNKNLMTTPPPSTSASLERLQEICEKNISTIGPTTEDLLDRSISENSSQGPKVFNCHLCTYTSLSREDYNSHVNGHYEFRCQKCEFMTKEEDEYRSHLKNEHDLTPEELEDEQGVRVPKVNSQGKVKTFRCKQCEFVSVTKEEFWEHTKDHIKPEKMLNCPKCSFVTEYKHHLEYHLRNHYGNKPFQCPSCSYSCVNKSMLNSHMKSHINIYQYRCADCTYATKYCHSLKLHLRKYGHKPSMVLNPDGTPNPLPIIDVYGTRRGPKIKRDDAQLHQLAIMSAGKHNHNNKASRGPSTSPTSNSGVPFTDLPQMQSNLFSKTNLRYSSQEPEDQEEDEIMKVPENKLKCEICSFETLIPDILENHMMLHEIKEEETKSSYMDIEEAPKKPTKNGKSRKKSQDTSSLSDKVESPAALEYFEYLKRVAPLFASQSSSLSKSTAVSADSNGTFLNYVALNNTQKLKNIKTEDSVTKPTLSTSSETVTSATAAVTPTLPPSTELFSRWYLENMIKRFQNNSSAEKTPDESDETDSCALDLSHTPELDQTGSPAATGSCSGSTAAGSSSSGNVQSGSSVAAVTTNGNSANSATGKSRRKGKAFKIKRKDSSATNDDEPHSVQTDEGSRKSPESISTTTSNTLSGNFICKHCEMAFTSQEMYELHDSFHGDEEGNKNPFQCKACGEVCEGQIQFNMHIAKKAHD